MISYIPIWLQMTRPFDRVGKKFTLYFTVKKGCYLYMNMLEMSNLELETLGVTYTWVLPILERLR